MIPKHTTTPHSSTVGVTPSMRLAPHGDMKPDPGESRLPGRISETPGGFEWHDRDDRLMAKLAFRGTQVASPKERADQRAVFVACCEVFEAVRATPEQDKDCAITNAQYIQALKEQMVCANGARLTLRNDGGVPVVTVREPDGAETDVRANPGETARDLMHRCLDATGSSIATHINNSRTLGVTLASQIATLHLGDCGEQFSIQSISKVFADITLALCEGSPGEVDGQKMPDIHLRAKPDTQPGHHAHNDAPRHGIPVKSAYSPHLFNQRDNLIKLRDPDTQKTRYEIFNASNNYGALTTTGRIPPRARIDGQIVEGRAEIVRTVMQGLMGGQTPITTNEAVLKGELADTFADHREYVKTYHQTYLPAKKTLEKLFIDKETIDWSAPPEGVARTVRQKLDSGGGSEALVRAWKSGPAEFGAAIQSQWLLQKDLLELIKPHMPDNLTRTLWLMDKGAFGPEHVSQRDPGGLQIARESEGSEASQRAHKLATEIMNAYTTHCAFDVSTDALANLCYAIASGGYDPEGHPLIPQHVAADAVEQMRNGGLYNEAMRIDGIRGTPLEPTKSGVGGGLISAVTRSAMISHTVSATGVTHDVAACAYASLFGDGGLSIAFHSRPLNAAGNSANGLMLAKGLAAALTEQVSARAVEAAKPTQGPR